MKSLHQLESFLDAVRKFKSARANNTFTHEPQTETWEGLQKEPLRSMAKEAKRKILEAK